MKKGYLRNVVNEAYVQRQLPRLGQIVTKAYSEQDDQRQYVVVGMERGEERSEIWIYPLGNVDYENTRAERVFPEGLSS